MVTRHLLEMLIALSSLAKTNDPHSVDKGRGERWHGRAGARFSHARHGGPHMYPAMREAAQCGSPGKATRGQRGPYRASEHRQGSARTPGHDGFCLLSVVLVTQLCVCQKLRDCPLRKAHARMKTRLFKEENTF